MNQRKKGAAIKEIAEQIIDYLKRNRISTTEVADCLGKAGALTGLMPCTWGYYKVGKIKWVYAYDETNWPLHEQIQSIDDGHIVFVDTYNCEDRAIFGQLVSKYLLLYHQVEAIIVQGTVRDAAALIKDKWPIWCRGYSPVGCFNSKPDREVNKSWKEEHLIKYNDAIAVCDDCGVVVIPKEAINAEFLEKLSQIEEQEDIWFDRLDHFKENTFDIVCNKTYMNDNAYMSRINQSSSKCKRKP